MPRRQVTRLATNSRKLGDKRNEMSHEHHKVGGYFSRSKDIHEDRGWRQTKLSRRKGG